jgi:hypothetical protein
MGLEVRLLGGYALSGGRLAKRKRQRVVAAPSAPAVGGDDKPWYKKAWPWVTGLAIVTSWVLLNGVSALSNAEKLPSAASRLYNRVSTWYHVDQEWTGKWTNEGDIDARYQPDIYIDLDLLVLDRSVQGKIGSGQQRDAIPYEYVLVEGSVRGDTLDILAFDYFHGIPKRIATFKITRIGSDTSDQIKVVTTWQAQPWFPKETTLWRAGETDMLPEEPASDS